MKKKCQVVMLATEKASDKNIWRNNNSFKLSINCYLPDMPISIPQHLYVTSNDEIKEGDYMLNDDLKVYKCTKEMSNWSNQEGTNEIKTTGKIITTTDSELHKDGVAKIGLDFIEKYITDYNKGNPIKEINVEYHYKLTDTIYSDTLIPKLNSDDTIIIHSIQEMFTREDMFKVWIHLRLHFRSTSTEQMREEFDTWLEQNY